MNVSFAPASDVMVPLKMWQLLVVRWLFVALLFAILQNNSILSILEAARRMAARAVVSRCSRLLRIKFTTRPTSGILT